ncbi:MULTISPECIES: AlpA family phage regulatory protein [unclassified Caballeronia]|uniref:AlpA family phage regulatory protein n=1 Tax=unclassified Caballeronia TaxID=2646786 RepID=UPI00285885F1|nr:MULTISPECIES: AlpA family phage regulatory protein [unclassified Caballeronia]MDR5777730.1 AlpA family phage regulatory protein [Caballeronia sp. LZ002]MDR5800578.1 AlpA family phage regulatory protein [Caballeronia sp. LZ001]MDR5802519.1 AlpA family phage regulatory protein [Caballeronia sp. LZ001]MDR5853160.1 AlpA family phage regulatory protein [Caballeronia sp. LZ003]
MRANPSARPEQSQQSVAPTTTLIKLPRVLEKTGLSRTAVYTEASFPKSIKISSRAVAWIEQEVDDWIAARIAASRSANETE